MAKIGRSTQFNPVTLGLLVTAVAAIGLVVSFIHAATPDTVPVAVACDFNRDGVINDADLTIVKLNIQHAGDASTGDCNGDGKVDGADALLVQGKMVR